MDKTAVITARIEPELKANAEQICGQLGLTLSQAITLFLRQVELQQGLPFDLQMPQPAPPLTPEQQTGFNRSEASTVDRNAFAIRSDFESPHEERYWSTRSPAERLRHMEILRRINYGSRATTRLQRVLAVTEGP